MSFILFYNHRYIQGKRKFNLEEEEKETCNNNLDMFKKNVKIKKRFMYMDNLHKKYLKKNQAKQKRVIIRKFKKSYNEENLLYLNMLMGSLIKKGHKIKSYKILVDLLFLLKKYKGSSSSLLFYSLNKIKPHIVLYNKRRGSTIYELPRLLSLNQERSIAIKWLIKECSYSKKNMSLSLFEQIRTILLNKSEIQKKKKRIIEISTTNKPFFYILKKR